MIGTDDIRLKLETLAVELRALAAGLDRRAERNPTWNPQERAAFTLLEDRVHSVWKYL